jgi:hypothetical protein
VKRPDHPLKRILELTQDQWDRSAERNAVRDNFRKVRACRTPALGGEVYAAGAGEKVFYHTCKSKCCPSCGNRRTLLWQREQWFMLPEIPFVGVVLTMPDVFWPVLRAHRHLQHDLPRLGAAVLQQLAGSRYRVRLGGMVIQHTFGGRLNHNAHLHIMVSAGGLKTGEARWAGSMEFDRKEIMKLWRFAVTSYLWKAHRDGLLCASSLPEEFDDLIFKQVEHRHYGTDVEEALPGIRRALYPPASYFPETHSRSDCRGSRLSEQRHQEQDSSRKPLYALEICCNALTTRLGSISAFNALLRISGTKN